MKSIFLKAQDSGWYSEFLKSVVEKIIEDEDVHNILDIGTGPGKLLELLINQDRTLQITGIDVNTAMIDEARRRLSNKNVSFQYQKKDEPLGFDDAVFDVITFCSVLFLLDNNTKTFLLNEALRVLKLKGKIIILTPTGDKSILSAFSEVKTFRFHKYNWTFILWKIFTSIAGRKWQKQKWLEQFFEDKKMNYSISKIFNNNASIETATKSFPFYKSEKAFR
ncbi:class I SAM-dependent methyltransferase [Flavobacterium sp. ZT3R18]|uniref:class I SAM-dependent methyltransferase n=1 Tax=Flavobacterium sp. ZT3R18 TaxID=2594429 RepID=UPI00117B6FE1|nr:class I SAM-dependent methyltransferase [Flavobacterium sp. ZT3R18]TRX37391.1 class I SAM-dependent methyltransferase [Flavobacterium sp. ZT3R18]